MNISCIYPLKKLDEPYLSAVKEYEKRLSRYCKCRFVSASLAPKRKATTKTIYITSGSAPFETLSSESFAEFLNLQSLHGNTDLHFVLSDSPAPSEKVISLSHAKLSFPMLTVLLSEQIYRGFRIIHNHSYHK